MCGNRGRALIGFIATIVVVAGVLGVMAGLFYRGLQRAQEAARRASCMSNTMQIGMAMIQYAGDHADAFMPLVDADGNEVPAVDNAGVVSSLPARSAFAVLLKQGYLTTTKVFICPSSGDRCREYFPPTYRSMPLAELAEALGPTNCSYGWDPTKRHDADASCAILAERPPDDLSPAANGTAANNTTNHRRAGQNVFYNDGHVKWGVTPQPDSGDDPDIYTGGAGYEKSDTDAKIIR